MGNATAAQLMAHLDTDRPDIRAALDEGRTGPLREALSDLVWRHGRSRSQVGILAGIGRDPRDPGAYLTYPGTKFAG
ncbi:hypothetical protein [Jannaschia sp. S6380]|uniref:hypothetical protein n=1 Tax=Jannaschia sp. S6380 TaxID=2926408 RepID=UPI0032B291B5